MAITTYRNPDAMTPAYNTNFFKIADADAIMPGYAYSIGIWQKQTTAAAYSLVGNFTQFPLEDGSLEFDANPIICNYLSNTKMTYSTGTAGYAYSSSVFQYKIVISRTYDGAASAVIKTWDPLYAFDGALTPAKYDSLAAELARMTPAAETQSFSFSSITTNMAFHLILITSLTLVSQVQSGQVTVSGTTNYNGAHNILEARQRTGFVELVLDTHFHWTEPSASGTCVAYKEPTVARSLSNSPNSLALKEQDWYSVDMFRKVPTASGVMMGISMQIYPSWKYYSLDVPNVNLVQSSVLTVGIGPMNMKAANWIDQYGNAISGATIFANETIDSYHLHFIPDWNPWPHMALGYDVTLCRNGLVLNDKGYDRTWLIYKSRLGGWSQLLFNMKSSKKQETKNVTYDRRRRWNETAAYRGVTNVSSSISSTYTLTSGWVDGSNWSYFEDLFSSPQVYMLRPCVNGAASALPYEPVSIVTTSAGVMKPNDDGVFSYSIEVRPANYSKRQRQ